MELHRADVSAAQGSDRRQLEAAGGDTSRARHRGQVKCAAMTSMTVVVCNRPGELQAATHSMPTIAEGEVLVRVKRVGVCGTDMHAFRGRQPYFSYPRIMGHEVAGVVERAPA